MEQYANVVQDLAGNVLPEAFVRVLNENGLTDSEIYDVDGARISNPVPVDAQGAFQFSAPNGKYFAQVEIANKVYKKLGPVLLFDPADVNTYGAKNFFDFMTKEQIADAQSGNAIGEVTSAFEAMEAYARENAPCSVKVEKAHLRHRYQGNLAIAGFTFFGTSFREVKITALHAGIGHRFDAFASGSKTAPYVDQCNVFGITFEGNPTTTSVVMAQGLARVQWDVNGINANPITGIAFDMRGIQEADIMRFRCSTDMQVMSSKPNEGVRFSAGTRGNVTDGFENVGNSSNNNVQYRICGLNVNVRYAGADQIHSCGGSIESAESYGLLVGAGCRYNTFAGTGFENIGAIDFADAGESTKYLNTYASNKVILQGTTAEIDGGRFELIQVDAGAFRNRIANVAVKNWTGTSVGVSDAGTDTVIGHVFDKVLNKPIFFKKDRANIPVTVSPFRYKNTSTFYEEIRISGGTVTQVLQYRGTDFWLTPILDNLQRLLAPEDELDISYSEVPSVNRIPHNGFQG